MLDGEVQTIGLAPNGDFWVGTDLGASRYEVNGTWSSFVSPAILPSPDVRSFAFSPDATHVLTPRHVTTVTTGAVTGTVNVSESIRMAISDNGRVYLQGTNQIL